MSCSLKFSLRSKMCLLTWVLGKAPRHWIFIRFWKLRACLCRLLPPTGKLRLWLSLPEADILGAAAIWWNSAVSESEIMIQGPCLWMARRRRRQDKSLLCVWFATRKLCSESPRSGIHLCKNVHLAETNPSLMSPFHKILILGTMVTCSCILDPDTLSLFVHK